MKKVLAAVLSFISVICIMGIPLSVNADDGNVVLESSGVIPRTMYLSKCEAQISLYNGELVISANTKAYTTVDNIGVTIKLQKLVGGIWYDCETYSSYKSNSASIYFDKVFYSYPKSTYYRAYTTHYVEKGSIIETSCIYTGSYYYN